LVRRGSYCTMSLAMGLGFGAIAQAQNWSHFRGDHLNGISSTEKAPVSWTLDSNIVWQAAIPGRGWSSPVIWDDQVWVTTATEDGKEMSAVCVDFNTGKTIFNTHLFSPDTIYRKHAINSYATPTPCIEEGFVYAHFGRYGTACLETGTGKVVWRRNDLECMHVQGPGSSPVIYKDLLILHYEGTDVQYIVALQKSTGKQVWRTDRPKELYDPLEPIGKKAYITPLIIQVDGRDLLISNGSAVCIAYDPQTGKEVWRIVQGVDSTISMPFFENGMIYFYTGFVAPEEGDKYAELFAVDPRGTGDITKSHIVWRMKTPILQLLTPVIKDGLIYTVDSKNVLMCLDGKTGQVYYEDRLRGKYNASPLYANGHMYFSSTTGKTAVINEGKVLEVVAENELEGEIWATPAISRNSLIIRTSAFLYRIEDEQ